MAKKYTGWKKRYSYLDNYKQGLDGKYVYYGRHYIAEGDFSARSYKLLLGLADILLVALFIVGGCMDAGAIWGAWYVIIPYALEALGLFLFIWKNVSFMTEKYPVKEYIYNKTVTWFKPMSVITIIACGLSFITTIICALLLPDYIKLMGVIIYLVTKLFMAAVCVILIKKTGQYKWVLDPSEEMEQ